MLINNHDQKFIDKTSDRQTGSVGVIISISIIVIILLSG